ncbi:MAG: bifunctional nuclease family protein [Acidimicrobiales bacterium]|nr:bifunctional nuclease family protein [Acidimicrobiales bacterium]
MTDPVASPPEPAAPPEDPAPPDAPEPAGGAEPGGPPRDDGTADFSTALVSTVSVDLPSQHATVVLRESESPRRHLSFSIGLPDGVALSHALRRIATPRPLTHELMTEVLEKAEVDVVAVRLVGRRGAVYFAELDVRSRAGRGVHPCRPSDGLTLALLQRVPVPVLIDQRLFEETGDVEPR